jgi:phage N-6-adenine-methyltransferase
MSPLVAAALLSRPLPAASAVSIIPPAAGLTDASGYRGGVPAHYDPAQGLKAVAVSEAAENYYRRAKDSAQLYAAVETKLGEQRRFVLWWDGQEKASGIRMKGRDAGGEYRASQIDDARTQLSDFGLDRDTIHRWRKRLKDPRKFDEELQRAQERCLMVCEERSSSSAQPWSGETSWFTPPEIVDAAREVMGGIDLDPASNDAAQQVVRAGTYYTAETDGLAQEWQGRVWLNPPYAAGLIDQFVAKLVKEHKAGNVTEAVLLVHSRTDTAWFHEAASAAAAICFTRGRVSFQRPDGTGDAPPIGSAFLYFGDNPDRFVAIFGARGLVFGKAVRMLQPALLEAAA